MDDLKVNKTIAEFIGWEFIDYDELPEITHISGSSLYDKENDIVYRGNHFTLSLDALVPIWERLEMCQKVIVGTDFRMIGLGYSWSIMEEKDTIQQAAAYATAKAIRRLSSE